MLVENAIVLLALPGAESLSEARKNGNETLDYIELVLQASDIKYRFVDTVPGWGNLNQDWLELKIGVDTSWGWCRLQGIDLLESERFHNLLTSGKMLMIVYYPDRDGKYVPHS